MPNRNVIQHQTDNGCRFADYHGNDVLFVVRDDFHDGWLLEAPGQVRELSSLADYLNGNLVLSQLTARSCAEAIQYELEAMGY